MEKYIGMTINERLYLSGLIKDFDLAATERNVEKVIEILNEVEIVDKDAVNDILLQLGLSHKK